MRITINTDTHTVEVHGAANYEQLTALVDTLVEHLKWPADAIQIIQQQPVAINLCTGSAEQRPLFSRPYPWEIGRQVFCAGATTA